MKRVRNERGIALALALYLAFVVLVTVAGLLYLITQGTVMSGYEKRYETSLEAAKGGADLVTKEVLLKTMAVVQDVASGAVLATALADLTNSENGLTAAYQSSGYKLNLQFTAHSTCLVAKLSKTAWEGSTDNWAAAGCNPDDESPYLISPTTGLPIADMQFTLQGPTGTTAQNYIVYAKIVDTLGWNLSAGAQQPNTSLSGLDLSGDGLEVTPQHIPFIYTVNLQSQRATNPDENSQISVLYAY